MGSQNVVQLTPSESFSITEPIARGGAKITVDPGAELVSSQARQPIPSYDLEVTSDGTPVGGSPISSTDTSLNEYVTGDTTGSVTATITNSGSTTGYVLLAVSEETDLQASLGKSNVKKMRENAVSYNIERGEITTAAATQRLDASLREYNPHPLTSAEHSGPRYYREHPQADNPVFTASDASTTVDEVADVFGRWIPSKGEYHTLIEGLVTGGTNSILHVSGSDINSLTEDGTVTVDGTNPGGAWPYMLQWDGEWYAYFSGGGELTKENWSSSSAFWEEWQSVETMASSWPTSGPFKDPTFTYYDPDPLSSAVTSRWWTFVGEGSPPTEIRIFYSEQTETGPDGLSWLEHTTSPITKGGDGTKQESPAGRPIVGDGYIDVIYFDNRNIPEDLRKYRYTNVGTGSGTMVETEIGRVSTGNQYATDSAGQGTHHAIEHIVSGPSGGSDVVFMDVGTPWEIVVGTPTNHPPMTDMKGGRSIAQSLSSTTWETVNLAGFSKDILNEADTTNNEINILETGYYRLGFWAQFGGDGSAGDNLWVRMRNITDDADVIFVQDVVDGGNNLNSVYIPGLQVELTGGKTYEMQVQNRLSDDNLDEWRLSLERVPGRDT